MYAGSIAIIAVIALMAGVFLKAGKMNYVLAVAPLILVPAAHLIGYPLSVQLGKLLPPRPALFATLLDLGALGVSAILFGFVAGSLIEPGKSRKIYLICCGLFSVVLTMVLVSSLVTY